MQQSGRTVRLVGELPSVARAQPVRRAGGRPRPTEAEVETAGLPAYEAVTLCSLIYGRQINRGPRAHCPEGRERGTQIIRDWEELLRGRRVQIYYSLDASLLDPL